MAQEIVGIKLMIDGQEKVVQSIGEVKKLLKQANEELLAAQTNFGEYSEQAVKAANKVAYLKDTIQEARETADLFDPGKKFQAFAGALSAVAGGFSAVQGALGLVGVESDKVQKTLLKVQSAMALSQGLSTIADSIKDFQRLGAVISNLSVVQKVYNFVMYGTATATKAVDVATKATAVSMRVLRGVMASLGIGVLVVGVTALISKIIEWTDSTSKAEKEQKKLTQAVERQNAAIDNEIKLLEAVGGQEDKIYLKRKQQIQNNINDLTNRLKINGKLTDEERDQLKKLATEKKVLDIEEQNRIKKNQEEVAKKRKEDNDKAIKDAKDLAEQKKKDEEDRHKQELETLERQREQRFALLQNINAKEKEAQKKEKEKEDEEFKIQQQKQLEKTIAAVQSTRESLGLIAQSNIEKAREQYVNQLNAEGQLSNESYKDQLKRYQLTRDLQRQTLVDRKATQAELAAFDAETKKGEIDREKAATQTKLGIVSGALGTIADAVGRNTIAGKALSIAQATIDTYAGANKALATYPPPWGGIAAGTVIAAGLLNVKKILSTKVPPPPGAKGVSDTTTAPAISSVTTPAPITPAQTMEASSTLINAQAIQELGSATNRAYVLETDVTNSQERIRRINRAARLT